MGGGWSCGHQLVSGAGDKEMRTPGQGPDNAMDSTDTMDTSYVCNNVLPLTSVFYSEPGRVELAREASLRLRNSEAGAVTTGPQ